jgi:hypothetical protein
MDEDEYDFIVNFDPDRDRSANRAELVAVLEYISVIVEEGLMPE